jgi:phosphoribosyl 1,2-cyclic phosphodiesterase
MRLRVLGSGSRGNATIIDSGTTRVLVDNGFALKELEQRSASIGFALESLDAVLVTHEHADHIKGVGPLARRYQLPVYATHGTLRSGKCGKLDACHTIKPHGETFNIGDMTIKPVPVPHDANEPCQFVFSTGKTKLGILTDLGHITPVITEEFRQLDMLLLECNHDSQMLADGPYPPALQARVGGSHGHLNNFQAMSLLKEIQTQGLQQLVLGHLSEKNNHPDRVTEIVHEHCSHVADRFSILQQDEVSRWFE